MKNLILCLTLISSTNLLAQKKEHAHGHSSLAAHEHGTVKMAMAIEGKTIALDMDGPSETFLGFEHKAVSKADLLALKNAKELWNAELLGKLVMFDRGLDCKVNKATFEQVNHAGEHSEIEARAEITCAKDPKGSDLKIGLKDKFGKIKNLKLEIIGNQNKTLDIKKAIENVRL